MKNVVTCFFFLTTLGVVLVQDAVAGQTCWNMEPYADIVKLTVSTPDPSYPGNKLVNGVWRDLNLLWPVVGSMVPSADGTQWIISFHGTRNDVTTWDLRASVDKKTKNGTWTIKDPGSGFTNNGTFTKVPCSTPFPAFMGQGESAISSTEGIH
jgi:hypothetical protein